MRTLSGVIVAGLVLAVAGCNDDGDKAPAASSPPPSASASAQPTDTASASAPAQTATDDAAKPSTSAATGSKSPAPTAVPTLPTVPGGGAKTTQGAIARYEEFLHATGREDIGTMCEIAAPAAKKAEDEGTGPCEQSFSVVVEQMISTQQKTALRTATVNPGGVTVVSPTEVEIPASAVRASVTFTSEDLGDMTLEYMNGNWYITD